MLQAKAAGLGTQLQFCHVQLVDYLVDVATAANYMPFSLHAANPLDPWTPASSYAANNYGQYSPYFKSARVDSVKCKLQIDNHCTGAVWNFFNDAQMPWDLMGQKERRPTTTDLQFALVFTYGAEFSLAGLDDVEVESWTVASFLDRNYLQRAVKVLPTGIDVHRSAVVGDDSDIIMGNATSRGAAWVPTTGERQDKTITLEVAVDFRKMFGRYYDAKDFTYLVSSGPTAVMKRLQLHLYAWNPRHVMATAVPDPFISAQYCTARLDLSYGVQFLEPNSNWQAEAWGAEH